jgi:hypothetical protein
MAEKLCDVFVRNWWRRETDRHGLRRLVPNPGARKSYLARGVTETEALAICKRYNETHKPGPLSRKAEFQGR